MCQFLSWVEKKENVRQKVYFLTYAQMHDKRGQAIQKRFPGEGELLGHSAIRAYYEFEGGKDKECTDFSTPANFPSVIVMALKRGEFKGLLFQVGLLLKPLDDKYLADLKPLYDKRQADRKTLDDKYLADLKPLYDKRQADRKTLDDKYWADRKTLADKHWADRKTLADKYWDLFADPNNRAEAWR